MKELPVSEAFLSQLETIELLVKNNVAGQFGGNHKSKTFGASPEFADYRDYMPGDDIKRIDWNAYGRTDKLFLRLYLDERQMYNRIYIDASRSVGYDKKGVQAIRLAAALAYMSVCFNDKVSISVIKDRAVTETVGGVLGKDAYFNAISALNDITFDGDSYISEAMARATLGYGDGLSVIISDFLTDNDYEHAIDLLAEKKRDILCLQVLSKDELDPKIRGKMHLFDSENLSRSYRKNINRDIINAYRAALDYATGRIRDYCAARGAAYLTVSAEEPVQKVLFGSLTDMGVIK